jgi:anti-anti-sigma factor
MIEERGYKVVKIKIKDHEKIKVMALDGEFFLGDVRRVEEKWDELVSTGPEVMAIDCKELKFVDSSAIGTLVKFLNNANAHSYKLIFFDLRESIIKIFEKAKLNKVFTIITRDGFKEEYLKK